VFPDPSVEPPLVSTGRRARDVGRAAGRRQVRAQLIGSRPAAAAARSCGGQSVTSAASSDQISPIIHWSAEQFRYTRYLRKLVKSSRAYTSFAPCLYICPAPQIRSRNFWRCINLYVGLCVNLYVCVCMSRLRVLWGFRRI